MLTLSVALGYTLRRKYSTLMGIVMATAAAVHILVKTEKEALSILEQLKKGKNFGALAKKHSTCPSGKRGGDLGEFRRGQMVKAFDDVVFKKEVLKVHGPVKTRFGFHIIKTLYRNN
jgi:peptidyl-prolyl cis-trans isomerase C